MNALRSDRRPVQTPPRRVLSLVLTIAVHAVLAVFLVYGLMWPDIKPGSLEVSLVDGDATPSGPAIAAAPPTPPAPPPEPPKPEPKPEPPPAPEPPPVPPPKPEIATKKPEPEKPEPKKPEPKKPEPKKPEPEKTKPKKPEPPLKEIDTKELSKQMLDQEIARTTEAKKVTEILGGGGQPGRQGTGSAGDSSGLDAYRKKVADKVKRNVIRPSDASGNPEAVFEVEQMETPRGGQVFNVKLKQSTGNQALDEAIERAIRKSDPLPLPDNRNLFRRRLDIKVRPLED